MIFNNIKLKQANLACLNIICEGFRYGSTLIREGAPWGSLLVEGGTEMILEPDDEPLWLTPGRT